MCLGFSLAGWAVSEGVGEPLCTSRLSSHSQVWVANFLRTGLPEK